MRYRASPQQRDLILRLLRGAELDTRRISLMHKPAFKTAALWCDVDNGRSMDEFLGELTTQSASRVIDALKDLQPEAK